MINLLAEIQNAYSGQENKIALVVDNKRYSYSELIEKSMSIASGLQSIGVKKHDKVAAVLPNGFEFIALTLATARLNATLVPLPLSVTPSAFSTACNRVSVKHLVCWHARLDELKSNDVALESLVSVGRADALENDRVGFETFYDKPPLELYCNDIDGESPFILTMTSGSTGEPKPIVLSQATKYQRASAAIALYKVDNSDITLIATPLYHSLAERLTFVSLLSGGTAILLPKYTVDTWLSAIEQHKVSFTIAVSSQIKQLLKVDMAKYDLASLKCLVSSSAILDHETKSQVLQKINCEFHECYGASEIAIATNIKFDSSQNIQSVGYAVPETEVVILGENGEILPPGEIGEIACKTPMIFTGYYNNEPLTKRSFSSEYFKTGDLGKLDANGRLFFIGRQKDIIITGGINIYPVDVEESVVSINEIQECVAFSFPDEDLGEVVALAIVLESMEASCEKTIESIVRKVRAHCAMELDNAQQPRKFFVFDSLPLNKIGKIDKLSISQIALNMADSHPQKMTFKI